MRISDWSSDVCSSDLRPLQIPWMPCQSRSPPEYRRRKPHPLPSQATWQACLPPSSERVPASSILSPSILLHQHVGKEFRQIRFRRGFREIGRSEEHTSELQSLMRISYAVFCLKKKKNIEK